MLYIIPTRANNIEKETNVKCIKYPVQEEEHYECEEKKLKETCRFVCFFPEVLVLVLTYVRTYTRINNFSSMTLFILSSRCFLWIYGNHKFLYAFALLLFFFHNSFLFSYRNGCKYTGAYPERIFWGRVKIYDWTGFWDFSLKNPSKLKNFSELVGAPPPPLDTPLHI